tara:strand:- start:169 stop:1653 length:1485 start_codon:yes stop_codon:yes gene_type:complete
MLFKPLWLFNNQNIGNYGNDDLSYWLHTSTLFLDYDLNYINDFPLQKDIFNETTNAPNHPIGSAFFSAPIVFLFHLFDGQDFNRLNPVGSYAYIGYFVSNLLFTLIAFYLLNKIIKNKKITKHSDIVLFISFAGTLVHYVATRFLMAHAIEFLLCTILIYIFEMKNNPYDRNNIFILFIIYFFLSVTRPSTFIYSLCLLGVYSFKLKIENKNIKFYFLFLSTFSFLHYWVSSKVYNTSNIFSNYSTVLEKQNISDEIDYLFIFSNLYKIPNLFFSFSMGVIWVCPIIIFGIISLFLYRKFIHKLSIYSRVFLFLYFFGALIVLVVWQGRDVAFGQRLLLGLVPFCVIRTSELATKLPNLKYLLYPLFTSTYLGYLYLYSSEVLTLRKGTTLWGTVVGYSGEDYFLSLIKNLLNIENIFSVLSRNIGTVNFLHFVKFENILVYFQDYSFIPKDKISTFSDYAQIYYELNTSYLLTVNFFILFFCYFFSKTILDRT